MNVFAVIWFGLMGSTLVIMFSCYMVAKLLWPWLKANRWVINDWEDWQ